MNPKFRRLCFFVWLAFVCWTGSKLMAQTNQPLVLADVGGFSNNVIYPPGNLLPVTDGQASWQPAPATPAQIVNLNDGGLHGKVLRRTQTGEDNIDYLNFPAVSNGALTVRFESRASTGERTLDVFLLPTSGGEVSLLGWGTITNKLCYYDGANWIPIRDLDTNWHEIEMIHYLSGPAFQGWDLKVDGTLLATNLPWRNKHPLGTRHR